MSRQQKDFWDELQILGTTLADIRDHAVTVAKAGEL